MRCVILFAAWPGFCSGDGQRPRYFSLAVLCPNVYKEQDIGDSSAVRLVGSCPRSALVRLQPVLMNGVLFFVAHVLIGWRPGSIGKVLRKVGVPKRGRRWSDNRRGGDCAQPRVHITAGFKHRRCQRGEWVYVFVYDWVHPC